MSTPMQDMPRIFVSHSSADQDFAERLTSDLRRNGADVWIYEADDSPGNIMERVDQMLQQCEWLVLVLSPDAVASRYVRTEVFVALNRIQKDQMRGVIPVVARWVSLDALPTWDALRRFDATNGYTAGLHGVLTALGMKAGNVHGARSPNAPSDTVTLEAKADYVDTLTVTDAVQLKSQPVISPRWFPSRMSELGFEVRAIDGVEVVIPPLCTVPAGNFLMGSDPKQDKDSTHWINEQPQHWVAMPAFRIARYPVTVAEYARFVAAGHKEPGVGHIYRISWYSHSEAQRLDEPRRPWHVQSYYLDHPVVVISWEDAVAYAAWLARTTGKPWTLPTEAEWEAASRWDAVNHHTRIFPWGDTFDQSRANTVGSGKGSTTTIGTYPDGASPCGAQDMTGNVWEWTSTIYRPYPYAGQDGRERADSPEDRVQRGGSWADDPIYARSAYRREFSQGMALDNCGFRLVLAVDS